jgi:hypothetical protein
MMKEFDVVAYPLIALSGLLGRWRACPLFRLSSVLSSELP